MTARVGTWGVGEELVAGLAPVLGTVVPLAEDPEAGDDAEPGAPTALTRRQAHGGEGHPGQGS